MKKIFSIFIIIIMTFRNVSIIAYSEESTNLTMFTIPILSNSRIEKIDAYVNINTLENNTEILITTNDFAILTQMEEVINNETNVIWNKGFNYFVLDKQNSIIKAYYIISSETIIDIKKIISSKEVETFKCQYINNTYYIDMQSAFQHLNIDYDCNFEIDSNKYIAINCIDTLDMLQKEYISNLDLYRYSYIMDKEEVNKSKAIKILDKNGLDIVGLVYDIEKERENISVDEYYKCLNIGLVEEGLEWLDYDSDSIEYIVLEKKLQKGADKFQQAIIDELKSIDSNTLKSVGTLESIVNGIGHIITMTGIAIDTLEVEIEREQEKYIIETIFNDIKKAEYTQEYFSLLSNSILQEYQYYAIEDNVDINNRKEFSEYMKNHKYAYRNGVRYNDTDIIRNTAILLYSDFCSYLNGEEYAKHIDINAFIEHYFDIMETTISLGFNLDSTEVASQYGIANDCYSFFVENNKDEFTWWQSLTNYSDNIITSYNFYNLRNAFLNVNSTSNIISKDSLIGSQKMEIMMLKALLKASESKPDFITDNQKKEIETSLKASSNLLFRLENCVDTYENNLSYNSIYNNLNNSELKLQNCNWLLDLNNNYTWHLSPTIEAEDIIVSDSEKVYNFSKNPFDEYSIVKQNGKFNFIKYDGTYISDNQYDKWYFSKPNAITCSSKNNECVTILGENGNEISYEPHDSGWGRKGYYIDNKTKTIYDVEYGCFATPYNEINNVVVQQTDITIIPNENNPTLEIEVNNAGKYGIANNNGLIVDCIYDDACMNIGDNIIALEKDGKWSYFNKDGAQIIDFVCEPFESKIIDAMWLHNHDSESIQHPFLLSSGYIPVKINGECGYYDTQGNEVIPCGTFEEVRPVHSGLAWVKKDGKWGVIKLKDIEATTSSTELKETKEIKSDNKTGEVKIEDGYLNVRDKPSTKGKIIGKLYNGDIVTIEESSADGKWLKINKGDIKGFVSKKYIRSKGNNSDMQTSSISDSQILKAVNKYLEENQSHLGVWLSDSDPYCPTEHMHSNETNWSCPINLSWESYSANEIAGAYPHFAYVDKSTLKCTLTANYETIVEFNLKSYIADISLHSTINGNSSWTSEQVINSVNEYLKENWCGENQYYCFESELIENEGYWWVCIRWDGSNSANVITGSDCKINKETGEVEISFNGEPYEWFNLKDYQ